MSWVMSASSLQCWDWNWLPALAVRALLTSVWRWPTTHGLGFSTCEACGFRSLHSHRAALWVQLPMIPQAPSGTASPALNNTMPQSHSLKKSEEINTLPFSCAMSVLIQVLWDKDRLLLGLCRISEQNKLTFQTTPPAPSHVQMASSYLDPVSCWDNNTMRTSCYARHVTNTGAGNKFFSKKQIKQSYP